MHGAFGFSESSSMVNIKIGIMMAKILMCISAPVKYSKKNCNVSSSFNQLVIDHRNLIALVLLRLLALMLVPEFLKH